MPFCLRFLHEEGYSGIPIDKNAPLDTDGFQMPSSPKRKRRLWNVDSGLYEASGKIGPVGRLLELLMPIGKSFLYSLLFAYPVILPIIGIVFGGLAFWGGLGGSVLLMAVLLSKFGYAKNFESRDFPFLRSIVGLCGGFLCALGLYLGLVFYNWWVFPIAAGLIGFLVVIALRRGV
jgi:hypothetical protein